MLEHAFNKHCTSSDSSFSRGTPANASTDAAMSTINWVLAPKAEFENCLKYVGDESCSFFIPWSVGGWGEILRAKQLGEKHVSNMKKTVTTTETANKKTC